MLVPVIGLVQVGAQSTADRYTYLPQIGLTLTLFWGASDLAQNWKLPRSSWIAANAILIALLSVIAWRQTRSWQNSETLWTHTLTAVPNNVIAEINYGEILFKRGQIEAARAHLEKALALQSQMPVTGPDLLRAIIHTNFGAIFREQKLADEAIAQFRTALKFQPDYVGASRHLGLALQAKGEVEEALTVLREGVKLRPENAETRVTLGDVLLGAGQLEEASAQYEEALRLAPDYLVPLSNLATLYATSRRAELRNGARAIELAERALRAGGSENAFLLQKLAAAQAETGNFPEAMRTADRALVISQREKNTALSAELQRNLALFRAGRPVRY